MRTVDVLVEARALVSRRFKRGTLTDGHGGYCSLGAIQHVRCKNDLGYRSYRNASRYLEAAMGARIHIFNDTHTKTEVMEAFDRAIKNARRRHIRGD